jgi:AraC-type transcriptional regulator N-terminus
LNITASR